MQNVTNYKRFITFNVFLSKNTLLLSLCKTFYYSKLNYSISNYYHCITIKLDLLKNLNFESDLNNAIVFKRYYCQSSNLLNEIIKQNFQKNESRFNEINLQMLSKNLYGQIFGNECNLNLNSLNESNVHAIKEELKNFGIITKNTSEIPNVNLSVPKLKGQNIEEHFRQISDEQVQPYIKIIKHFLNDELPPMPKHFIFKEGWTRYSNNGHESVDYPKEDGLIFDVEVCVKNGPLPTLATAVSKSSWYSWVSKQLIDCSSNFMFNYLTPESLIPMESSITNNEKINVDKSQQMPKIIIGHNVSFDRVRIKEQYWLNPSATKFLDTMALHICISGLSSYQRAILKSVNSRDEHADLNSISSLNNLSDIHKLYYGSNLNKHGKDIFINGEIQDIQKQFNESMLYCASDVEATHKIFKKMFPIFIKRFPHPATLAGMLELSTTYLPVNYNWTRYLEEAETTYKDLNFESRVCLAKRADEVCRLSISSQYKNDPWMWDEDWSIKNINLKKGYDKILETTTIIPVTVIVKSILNKQFKYLHATESFLPKKLPHMPGYPNWYRKLCDKNKRNVFPRTQQLSTSMLITPKLLNLTWEQYPLYHIKNHGWGFLVKDLEKCDIKPSDCARSSQTTAKKLQCLNQCLTNSFDKNFKLTLPDNKIKNFFFFKLPHKNGFLFNVGSPLSKDFLNNFSKNILDSITASTSRIIDISKMSSYWKNNRDRILSQLVIWLDSKQNVNSKDSTNFINFGAIIPQVIVSGTLTRRAVEPTWMTASNAHCERIGSELRGMISAPSGYSIIGADVDSQELWIASIIGDAFKKDIKIHGATPFSWMTLIGNKSDGTDMHSVTAKAIGITRDQAKILNYARIYGAGQKFAERLLKQFNPSMTDKEATLKSKQIILMTKGKKYYRLKKQYLSENLSDKLYTSYEAFKISQINKKLRDEVFEKGKWIGGSESVMFNSLEEIADQNEPSTPFLNGRLSRALEYEKNEKFLPTKINWVVQSGAVDFLHLILVTMRWLMKDKARLCLSFHDEVRYLVPSEYKYNAALAMHVTNLLVRCFFVSRLNMKDLPMSVAFFTSVEVDSVLRKETSQDCKTPSNPHGLKKGYGIEHGESLDIWTAVNKSKGYVGMFKSHKE